MDKGLAKVQEMPLGSSTKRELSTLTRNLEILREERDDYVARIQRLEERLTTLESKPLVVSQAIKGEKGEKGDKGERGEPGSPGETRIIMAPQPEYRQGAWCRFWRRCLLGTRG